MDVSEIAISWECKIITRKDKTQFFFDKDEYVVPFLFPIESGKGKLFVNIYNYSITERWEDGDLIGTDFCFQLYDIELYENQFKKAMEDFKNIILLECSDELKKDVLVKAFARIIDISWESYDMARCYLKSDRYRDKSKTFRQYCGLETCQNK